MFCENGTFYRQSSFAEMGPKLKTAKKFSPIQGRVSPMGGEKRGVKRTPSGFGTIKFKTKKSATLKNFKSIVKSIENKQKSFNSNSNSV